MRQPPPPPCPFAFPLLGSPEMEAGFIGKLFLLSFLLALTGLWIFRRGFLRCWYASQGGRGKTPFQWARVDFSSDGLKGQSRPTPASKSILGILHSVFQMCLRGHRPFRLLFGVAACFYGIAIVSPPLPGAKLMGTNLTGIPVSPLAAWGRNST